MTEAWTGRKYRGISTGLVYTVLSEPFEFEGAEFVVWHEPSHNHGSPMASDAQFANREMYTRILEPKFSVGDTVEDYNGTRLMIDAVPSKPDADGDWPYIALDSEGNSEVVWQNYMTKVSQ